MRPEDLLPDGMNEAELRGARIRKGTIGAFVLNARVLVDPAASEDSRREAEADLVSLVPILRGIGLFDVFEVRDPRVRALVDKA